MKVLLSPAKAIDMSKRVDSVKTCEPMFLSEAEGLMKKMQKLSVKKLEGMMNISTDLAELNRERNQNWKSETELEEGSAHAIAAFDGDTYRGFDALSLDNDGLYVAQEKVRILSGLYGLLKPLDVIYPYRLEMGTRWDITSTKKNLYDFWGNKIANTLNEEEQDVIVNCASNEYFKAAKVKKLKAKVITPVFKDLKNGDYKVIMVYAKKSRGAMARYIVDNKIDKAEDIKNFNVDGYRYDANLSTEDEWVFTR